MSGRATITPDTEWVLAIDFGTVNTCAAVREDGRVRVLQLEGESRMPSAIFREPDGRILVGRAAERRALLDPDRFEGTPKRYLEVGREASCWAMPTFRCARPSGRSSAPSTRRHASSTAGAARPRSG